MPDEAMLDVLTNFAGDATVVFFCLVIVIYLWREYLKLRAEFVQHLRDETIWLRERLPLGIQATSLFPLPHAANAGGGGETMASVETIGANGSHAGTLSPIGDFPVDDWSIYGRGR